jgi:hypothetical protein
MQLYLSFETYNSKSKLKKIKTTKFFVGFLIYNYCHFVLLQQKAKRKSQGLGFETRCEEEDSIEREFQDGS